MKLPFRTDIRGEIKTDNDLEFIANNILMLWQTQISL